MSSPTHDLGEAQLTITSADTGSQSASRSPFRPEPTKTPHSSASPTAERPSLLLLTPLLGATACAVLIGGLVAFARDSVPAPSQQELVLWEQDCLLGTEPTSNFQQLASRVVHPGVAPGNLGRFGAEKELVTFGELNLADVILALGAPDRVGCLDYGILPGPTPVMWTRIVMDKGQFEAYAVLPYDANRLTPDTAVHTLRCYSPDDQYPQRQTYPWHGFTSLPAYPACPPVGTATPR